MYYWLSYRLIVFNSNDSSIRRIESGVGETLLLEAVKVVNRIRPAPDFLTIVRLIIFFRLSSQCQIFLKVQLASNLL